jgi:chromosome segregation ATPase
MPLLSQDGESKDITELTAKISQLQQEQKKLLFQFKKIEKEKDDLTNRENKLMVISKDLDDQIESTSSKVSNLYLLQDLERKLGNLWKFMETCSFTEKNLKLQSWNLN